MTLEQRIISLATAIGGDIKTVGTKQGNLSDLSTSQKASIVSAINEVFTLANAPKGAQINDAAANTANTVLWSPQKVTSELQNSISSLRSELTAGASASLDTFKELADAMGNDPSFATTIATGLNNRVRFDAAQTLTVAQKLQACTNIGIGDPERDFVAEYNTAKS